MPLEKLGPYRLEKLLGRGGMGAVYAGINETTGERAAVKVLAAHLADNSDFRERFTSEVETLKKLKHPNIVQLLAYGEEGEHLFYVMELVDGRSLQDELQSGRRYDWREVAKIGVDICRALKHAHDSGVIHRDLKPANLLVDSHNQVKLTDFGIAKLYGGTQITAAGGILGTADYMSPEQAEGKPVNARSDLYSLGSVLYALLSGRPPFAAKSLAEVIHNLRFEKPTPVRRLSPDTPEQFEVIILQLLEKDPGKRISSAFAVSNYLRAMEHALSLETQVGQVSVEDLPLDTPSSGASQTVAGTDLTIVTNTSNPAPATAVGGATAEMSEAGDAHDYHLSAAEVVTVVPRSATALEPKKGSVEAPAEEPALPKSRFVTIQEEEALRKKRERRDEEGPPIWMLIGGMALAICVLVGLVTFALLPPSADSLYARIAGAAETEDLEKLKGVDTEIGQFLERFPDDPRADEIKRHQDRLEIARLERQFQVKVRTGRAESLSPIERVYFDAVRLAESDPEKALQRFQAIIDVFGQAASESAEDDHATKACVELARRQVESLKQSIEETSAAHRKLIEARLDEADKLRETSAGAAKEIYQGVVELYSEKAWAEDLVRRAKQSLEQ